MEEFELSRIKNKIENIKKFINKLYLTTSVKVESTTLNELIKETDNLPYEYLIELSKELDIFGKSVLHYKLPLEIRTIKELYDETLTTEEDRINYFNDYKLKLKSQHLGIEEEYNKLLLMACMLHVPLNNNKQNSDDAIN